MGRKHEPVRIVEIYPDNTCLWSNGVRMLSSIGRLPNGEQKPLNQMTEEEHQQWHDRLQKIFNENMNEYYRQGIF